MGIQFPETAVADWADAKRSADARPLPPHSDRSRDCGTMRCPRCREQDRRERNHVWALLKSLDVDGVIETLPPAQRVALLLYAHKVTVQALCATQSADPAFGVPEDHQDDGMTGAEILAALETLDGVDDE